MATMGGLQVERDVPQSGLPALPVLDIATARLGIVVRSQPESVRLPADVDALVGRKWLS